MMRSAAALRHRAVRPAVLAGARRLSSAAKIKAPPMVFIKGEEMTRYCMQLVLDEWIEPRFDTSAWEYYDLSCVARDDTEDKVSGEPRDPA